MDTHPAHWRATLLGYAFWRDAEVYNKPIHDSLEAEEKKHLHKSFPFTLGQEQPITQLQTQIQLQLAPDSPNPAMPDSKDSEMYCPRRRRRLSMSDAFHLHSTHLSRRRARSSICSDTSDHTTSSQEPTQARPRSSSRSRSLLRLPLTFLRGLSNTRKRPNLLLPIDQATPANPILEFRGGDTWDLLTRDRSSLGLDLFWPIDFSTPDSTSQNHNPNSIKTATAAAGEEGSQQPNSTDTNDEQSTFPLTSLIPLLHFRHLRALKLTGMMASYQKYIWQAAWLNPHLEELELGMTLAPSLRRNCGTSRWPCIRGGWMLAKVRLEEPVYYGTGRGTLHPALGLGEYLDKMLIEKAKVAGMAAGKTRTRLSIRTLVLSGFVVDADPFLQWFDCARLKCVRFGDGCVDAGLWLGDDMAGVTIVWPRESEGEVRKGVVGRVVQKGEVRVVRVL